MQNCELIPFKNCVLKTKLVPRLKAIPICTQVPREICTIKYIRGEKIQKEIVSIWCRPINQTENGFANDITNTMSTNDIDNDDIMDILVDYELDLEMTTLKDESDEVTLPSYQEYIPAPTTSIPLTTISNGENNLPNYDGDKPENELESSIKDVSLPGYGEDDSNLDEQITTLRNELLDEELPNYSIEDAVSISDGYLEPVSQESAPNSYVPPVDEMANSEAVSNDYLSPQSGSSVDPPSLPTYKDQNTSNGESIEATNDYLSPDTESLPSSLVPPSESDPIVSDYSPPISESAPNGYLPPNENTESIASDYLSPSSESLSNNYISPNELVTESEPIGNDYLPPIAESAPNGYLPPFNENFEQNSLPSYGSVDELPNYIIEDTVPIPNDYLSPGAESLSNSYVPPNEIVNESEPIGSDYLPPIAESAPDGYLPPNENAESITNDYLSSSAESAPEGYLPPNDNSGITNNYLSPIAESIPNSYLPPTEEAAESESVNSDYGAPIAESAPVGYLPPYENSGNTNSDLLTGSESIEEPTEIEPNENEYISPSGESAPDEYLPPSENYDQNSLPIYGSVDELPNYIIEDTVSLTNGYLKPSSESSSNDYSAPIQDLTGSESIANEYVPPALQDYLPTYNISVGMVSHKISTIKILVMSIFSNFVFITKKFQGNQYWFIFGITLIILEPHYS